jgi:uncharacterized protein YutE (UPF0331/DUF86 family)
VRVVVREEALAERLALLRSTVLRLQAAAGRTLDDDWDQWALERGLQLAAQALFDVGNHVLAGSFAWRPKDYAEVVPELARRGVISSNLEQRLRGLAGFRNLLVHEYVAVDPARVRELLRTRLGDFTEFADAVEAWLQARVS